MQTNTDPVYRTGFSDGFAAHARQPNPAAINVGDMQLQRLPNGQLTLGNGVTFTSLNAEQFEDALKKILANRWNALHAETGQTYESSKK